jgi:hypothetical protein
MDARYAVVIGEALIDLIEAECEGQTVYRPLAGGGPMNIAVGLARLGARVEFVGSFEGDPLADWLTGCSPSWPRTASACAAPSGPTRSPRSP